MKDTKMFNMKRDGVCNPVTLHVLKTIEVFKRFGLGCKPRPASLKIGEFIKPD
jgi:hypothetical protein